MTRLSSTPPSMAGNFEPPAEVKRFYFAIGVTKFILVSDL